MLSYPSDEVGNHLISLDRMDEAGVNPYTDILSEARFRELFGYEKHRFTGVDYIQYYKELIQAQGCEAEIVLANDCRAILNYTRNVICCDIHSRERSKRLLRAAGAEKVFGLDDILSAPVNGSGYNEQYGLLGSNKATEDSVKLFPRDCQPVVDGIARKLYEATGKNVEVMVYGDGAFKDPVGKIWELADPVVSPAYTAGLEGLPNEIKMKYLADNDFADLSGDALKNAISEAIKKKDSDLKGQMVSEGTTPRRLTDLLGSLCDLTSGSGDKGTPIIWIQGYFDNFTAE
ncbi:MAG: coenzyme F420-0:L-glutamate ligase, partial [Firmicutes bacterium]|nr:coenzyme F420-0:L-glutamate ligase [Bacillota bacterium]